MKSATTYYALLTLLMLSYANAFADSQEELVASRATVDSMLAEYQTAYPKLRFAYLQDPLDSDRLDEIYNSFDDDAENVDYEHPRTARADLLAAQRQRIEIMLQEGLPSATLFKTGHAAASDADHVCVLTLDPAQFTGEAGAATRLLSEGLEFTTAAILNNEQFLRFTVDHEIFHCLDAYLNGPTRPRTDSFVSASYHDYLAEQRADLYAGLAHQAREHGGEAFLRTVAMYRVFAILDWDIEHYSAPVLFNVANIDPSFSLGLTLPRRVRFAMGLADHWLASVQEYESFAVSAAAVSLENNRAIAYSPLYQELSGSDYEVDDAQVAQLRSLLRVAKQHVTSTIVAALP